MVPLPSLTTSSAVGGADEFTQTFGGLTINKNLPWWYVAAAVVALIAAFILYKKFM